MDRPKINCLQPNIMSLYQDKSTCFLVTGTKRALLIDTGHGTYRVDETVRQLTDLPLTVVNTHAHPDHAGGDGQFPEIWVHPLARTQLTHPNLRDIQDGDIFDLGGIRLTALYTPGHTPDGICFAELDRGYAFIGDILEDGHLSIRDLDGYISSIQRLLDLRDRISVLYPSHGTCPIPLDESVENVRSLLIGIREDSLERVPMKLGPPPDSDGEVPPDIDPDQEYLGYRYKDLLVLYDPARSGWD